MKEPEAIVQQLINGDFSVFPTLVNCYEDRVFNTAINIVQNAEDADDITQEVFVQVYLSINAFKGDAKFSTWLYQVTISKALDHERKKKRKKRFGSIQSFFIGKETAAEQIPTFDHPGVQLEQKENARQLYVAIKKLPTNQKIAFTLHKMEGQSYQQIAAIMQISLTAVESLMARAKANLKISLQQFYTEHHQ